MDINTEFSYYPWQNKDESVIGEIKGKKTAKGSMEHKKIVWDFGMVWEDEIYSLTTVKDESAYLYCLIGDTLNI